MDGVTCCDNDRSWFQSMGTSRTNIFSLYIASNVKEEKIKHGEMLVSTSVIRNGLMNHCGWISAAQQFRSTQTGIDVSHNQWVSTFSIIVVDDLISIGSHQQWSRERRSDKYTFIPKQNRRYGEFSTLDSSQPVSICRMIQFIFSMLNVFTCRRDSSTIPMSIARRRSERVLPSSCVIPLTQHSYFSWGRISSQSSTKYFLHWTTSLRMYNSNRIHNIYPMENKRWIWVTIWNLLSHRSDFNFNDVAALPITNKISPTNKFPPAKFELLPCACNSS